MKSEFNYTIDFYKENDLVAIYEYDPELGCVESVDSTIKKYECIYAAYPNYLVIDYYSWIRFDDEINCCKEFAWILSELNNNNNLLEDYINNYLKLETKLIVIKEEDMFWNVPSALENKVKPLIQEYMNSLLA